MSDFNDQIIREFRENGGAVERFGKTLVLLHDVGAKSGTEYVHPVAAMKDADGSWLVAGSAAGRESHPAWYRNLVAHPDIDIETPDDGTVPVHVVDLPGAERDEAWERFTQKFPAFLDYEKKTDRTIPVLRLTRR